MQTALGVLGWTPDEFWSATLTEFNAAVEGWNMANGASNEETMTRRELEELMRAYPDEQ